MDILIGIVLIVAAVFLVVAVLMQSGKDKSLSGTIAGGSSETFYGKNKANSQERKLSRWTTVVAVLFVAIVLVCYIVQDDGDIENLNELLKEQATATETTSAPASSDVVSTDTVSTHAVSTEDISSEVTTTEALTTDADSDAPETTPASTENN